MIVFCRNIPIEINRMCSKAIKFRQFSITVRQILFKTCAIKIFHQKSAPCFSLFTPKSSTSMNFPHICCCLTRISSLYRYIQAVFTNPNCFTCSHPRCRLKECVNLFIFRCFFPDFISSVGSNLSIYCVLYTEISFLSHMCLLLLARICLA